MVQEQTTTYYTFSRQILNMACLLNFFQNFSSLILSGSREEQSQTPEYTWENCEGILIATVDRDAAD